jgi:hypothetical protein
VKKLILVLICIALLVLIPAASAAPAQNKGSDVSTQKAADVAKQNANENAAFNRASFTCPEGEGWASSENYCLYSWLGGASIGTMYI